jgi:hypothetical protein
LGNTVGITGPNPTTLGNPGDTTANNKMLGQNTLNALYTGTNQGTCLTPTTTPTIPSLGLSLKQNSITEGSTVTAVAMTGTGITGVTLTWGDGSTPTHATFTVVNNGYVGSHVYPEEASTPFTVKATATVGSGSAPAPATAQVRVVDAPLQLSALSVTPSQTVDVMEPVTVSGTLLNPESGEPVSGSITWGDGTKTNVTVDATGHYSATHVYDRLTPVGKPAAVEPVTVALSETDGTKAGASTSVTVNDVAPTDLVSPTGGAIVTAQGTVFTHTGTSVTWTSEVTDVSPAQAFTYGFNWNDGSKSRATVTKPTPSAPTGTEYTYPVASGAAQHAFADACLYTVTTTATDDDTLSTTMTTPVVVTAPLSSDPAAPLSAGYWQQQYSGGSRSGSRLPVETRQCFLAIAQHLSPALGPDLTTAAAVSILKGAQHRPLSTTKTQRQVVQLRQELLTVLLDFADGSWNWTEVVGPNQVTPQMLVANANTALTTKTPNALKTALHGLDHAQGFQPPPNLTWSPSTNGIFAFGTVNAGTHVVRTFTITNRGSGGKPKVLPSAVPVALTGPSGAEFTVTANTCPAAASPHAPRLTSCTVTVEFTPAAGDTAYNETMTAGSGARPLSLTLTGTGT